MFVERNEGGRVIERYFSVVMGDLQCFIGP